jgi:predicted helicase
MKKIFKEYLNKISEITRRGDAREESYYPTLKDFLESFASALGKKIEVTVLPKRTEAGNPDFRIWDGSYHVIGYIEAKSPGTNLDHAETSDQLKRYLHTFPNVILTNFYEFRLYRNAKILKQAFLARSFIPEKLKTLPPIENFEEVKGLFEEFFSFVLPSALTAESLSRELARRTRFLRDEVIRQELQRKQGDVYGFYEAFKKFLIPGLSEDEFADLYAQTITYGLFVARTRANNSFNRRLAHDLIPSNIGILRDVFRYISLGRPTEQMEVIIDDIASVLNATNIQSILMQYYRQGKGDDPIMHFYETFLAEYDPETRERRGVYYTPLSVVHFIVRSVHYFLQTRFDKPDGLADESVTLLDPAAGTLTFPAEAIRLAFETYVGKYGEGGKATFLRKHILPHFYAFELLMAPYAIGHMKINFLFEALGVPLRNDERFQLYLTNTLEMEKPEQIQIPGLISLSEENQHATKVKKDEPILVILGNPPYSGISANQNDWTEILLKTDIDGTQSYYTVDGAPLRERNPKWLQDDYVKFIRFAQWKIHRAGRGIVAMITNHSYLDNPTFRGMRQSLLKSFNEIFIINLHGNSLKRETAPDGSPDENVFDIRQGVAIGIFIGDCLKSST